MGAVKYTGRFAPTPNGPLHAGSLVAALASWLDARAHQGQWLVRIEDVDTTRCLPGLDQIILQQLAACGLHSDQHPVYQSRRGTIYQSALDTLAEQQLAYPCDCTRKDIETALLQSGRRKKRHDELVYPGTCRSGPYGRAVRAWRLHVGKSMERLLLSSIDKAQVDGFNKAPVTPVVGAERVIWHDRRLGPQRQDVAAEVGDFVLKRADGCFAYQLAVVMDDAAQGINNIVRGEDLADNTARQILLQQALGLPTPRYLHTPLVLGPGGVKLSKQSRALAINTQYPIDTLNQAAVFLGLPAHTGPVSAALSAWTRHWADLYPDIG